MPNLTETVYQGWLTKSPPSSSIFRPRWRRRWFVLRTGPFPNQFVLEYYTDQSCRRQKGRINLDECEQLVGPLSIQDRHRYTFHIRTPSRTYYLAADSEPEMSKWVAGLCQVCGLKTMEEESEGTIVYSRAGDENNQPDVREQREEATESDESSPTLSNKIPSGPYIPISECFTGKPIPFNDKPESQDVTYCNTTVFQFPPKVNWATHPTKRDQTDMEVTPSTDRKGQPIAPPRPPKKGNPPVAVTVSSPQPSSAGGESVKMSGNYPGTPFETEETHDSSSTCSSLHSPPGSAGVVYSNISDICDPKSSGGLANQHPSTPSGSSQALKSASSPSTNGTPPPVVDRNLKPLRRESKEPTPRTQTTHFSPTQKLPTPSYSSGTMTLPSRNHHSHRHPTFVAGPVIDRTRKPFDGHLTLGPTPVQMKGQSSQSFSHQNNRGIMGTLPSSALRRAGPVISPNDKKPTIYHEYEQAPELKGTYLQIECQGTKESESPKFPNSGKLTPGKKNFHPDTSGSVEYRLIDPVKTKALNKTREDREKQFRNNTLSKSHN